MWLWIVRVSVCSFEMRWPMIDYQNVKMIILRLENRPVRIYVGAGWKNEILRGVYLFFLYILYASF